MSCWEVEEPRGTPLPTALWLPSGKSQGWQSWKEAPIPNNSPLGHRVEEWGVGHPLWPRPPSRPRPTSYPAALRLAHRTHPRRPPLPGPPPAHTLSHSTGSVDGMPVVCLAPYRPEDTVGMMHTGPFLMRLEGRDPKVAKKNTRIWGYRQGKRA